MNPTPLAPPAGTPSAEVGRMRPDETVESIPGGGRSAGSHATADALSRDRLAAAGARRTPQRLLILKALQATSKTMTAQELLDRLRRHHPLIGRATVFRNLDALVDAGLAQRFERPGHVYAYAGCSPGHHHHLICSVCNATEEISENLVEPVIEVLRGRHGFWVKHSALDFYGLCASCALQGGGS